MRKLYVPLHDRELAALKTLAARERRRPQDQAAVLLGIALAPPNDAGKMDPNQRDPGPCDSIIGGSSDGTA
jgi:hypothetical protein